MKKKTRNYTTFFVRPLESTGRSQIDAEVNIMMNANYSSINLYTQLPIVAEIRPTQSHPYFSARRYISLPEICGYTKPKFCVTKKVKIRFSSSNTFFMGQLYFPHNIMMINYKKTTDKVPGPKQMLDNLRLERVYPPICVIFSSKTAKNDKKLIIWYGFCKA